MGATFGGGGGGGGGGGATFLGAGGAVTLNNVELRTEVVQEEVESPFIFKRIFIQELKLNIPWASLRGSKPTLHSLRNPTTWYSDISTSIASPASCKMSARRLESARKSSSMCATMARSTNLVDHRQ